MIVLGAMALCGCDWSNRSQRLLRPPPPPAPQARQLGPVQFATHTLTLNYALPGRPQAPESVGWELIDIRDEAGAACTPTATVLLARGSEGYWTSLTFAFPPTAQRLNVSLRLRVDEISYPLSAVMTRVDPTHWRIDHGVKPPPPEPPSQQP